MHTFILNTDNEQLLFYTASSVFSDNNIRILSRRKSIYNQLLAFGFWKN